MTDLELNNRWKSALDVIPVVQHECGWFACGLIENLHQRNYTASAHPVESACQSSLLLAVCRLIANITWKYPNSLNS